MTMLGLCFFYYKKKYFIRNISCQNESPVKSNLRHFTYKELDQATNGFREELGRGSCGVVYKGHAEQSGPVAVKILDRMFQDNDKEFQAEVNVIGLTHHKNLVRLVGYCDEKQHRLLVYEFMRNGTLASFLFGALRPSWYQRIQIAFGIAKGLVYLHEECSTQIIHYFGLAKLLMTNQSHTKTNIRGTKGYVAPDWFRSAPITVKVDVYSFGVLLLEIICCRRNVLVTDDGAGEKVILTDWAYDCYTDRRIEELVENDMEAQNENKMVERFVMVALWCLQEDPSIRPTMKKVMLMLEGILQVSPPPFPSLSSSIS
ncbi:Tegument protein UL11, Herpesvirus [Trema orientale]|uniref:non-specific serine/threonine protein kinase n=1 Tax=Trema orientale TaxID=63057 RepID=A0A2P5FU56_TREOI|nr:Tegument protein UL11, Herpesvirus [Trema orientale]